MSCADSAQGLVSYYRPIGLIGDHTLVITFSAPVTSNGLPVVIIGIGTVASSTSSGNTITVNLTGVADGRCLAVRLPCLDDGSGNVGDVTVYLRVLLGDTTGNGSVNASDRALCQSQVGVVTAANFRCDTTVNGFVNASDIAQVSSRSGLQVGPCPP